jgi:hypothetical protein
MLVERDLAGDIGPRKYPSRTGRTRECPPFRMKDGRAVMSEPKTEEDRVEAEKVRVAAEAAREAREHARQQLETARQDQETLRRTAEDARRAAEDARHATIGAVAATAEALNRNLAQMQFLESARETLRTLQPKRDED